MDDYQCVPVRASFSFGFESGMLELIIAFLLTTKESRYDDTVCHQTFCC